MLTNDLPAGWEEHWHLEYQRHYYYNEKTGQSVWERPRATPTTKPDKQTKGRNKMNQRPLPSMPTPVTAQDTNCRVSNQPSNTPRRNSQRPLPTVPSAETTQDTNYEEVSQPQTAVGRKSQRPLPTTPSAETAQDSNYEEMNHPPTTPRRKGFQPLPAVPSTETTQDSNYEVVNQPPSVAEQQSVRSHDRTRSQLPLPTPPSQGDVRPVTYNSSTLPPNQKLSPSQRDLRTHTPKVDSFKNPLPPLPPKEQSLRPELPSRGHSISNRSPRLPGRKDSTSGKVQKSLPPLPPKDDGAEKIESAKPIPQQPSQSAPPQQNGGLPPLPPKEDSKPLPPLPPKSEEYSSPTIPPSTKSKPSPSHAKPKKKKVVEYEDTVLLHQPSSKPSAAPPAAPPLPEKELSPAVQEPPRPLVNGGPRPLVNGGPPPPPPPPSAPPPPSPLVGKPRVPAEPVSVSDSSGRPFTANDLTSQRTMLKKRAVEDTKQNAPAASGIAGLFANAIDTRLTNIRRAMVDSDSEPSDFEDVDDDDDDWD